MFLDFLVFDFINVYCQKGMRFRTSVMKKKLRKYVLLIVGVQWSDMFLNGGHLNYPTLRIGFWLPVDLNSLGQNM